MLTLDRAIELSLQANRKLDNASLEVQKAGDSLAAARTQYLPSLNFEAFGSYNLTPQEYTYNRGILGTYTGIGPIPSVDTRVPSQSGVSTTLSASITQPIAQLYRIGLMVDQHDIQQSMASQQLRSRRQDLVKQVKQQYYEILKTQSALQASEDSILFYRELAQLVGRYVKEKVALDYQRLETEARLAKAEHTARSERNALQTQQEKLNNLLGRDVKTPFQVSTTEIAVGQPLEQSAAEASALAQRPDIHEAKLKLAQAQTGYKIKRSEYLPDLNLQMRYSRFLNVDFIPEQEWAVGLQLKWEFYDWGRKSHDLAGKTVGVTQAQNDVRDTEAQVLIEVDSRLRELQEARELVKVTQLSVAAAREKLRVTMNLYRQKSALLKDVLQAQSDLTDANSEFQNALLSLWTAQAQLDKALGVG